MTTKTIKSMKSISTKITNYSKETSIMYPYNNPYQNPHPNMPVNQGPRPIQHNVPQQQVFPQQMPPQQQTPYWATQHPGYQPGVPAPGYPQQGMPQQQMPQQGMTQPGLQLINTQNGVMIMDVYTGRIIGPYVPPQQAPVAQGRPPQAQPFQGQFMQPQGLPQPQEDVSIFGDNRFSNAAGLVKPKEPVVEVQAQADKPLPKPKLKASSTGYIATYCNKPFTKEDAVFKDKDSGLIAASLDHLAFYIIDDAHDTDDKALLWIHSGVIINKYYNTSLLSHEKEMFQSNIEKVFRDVKKLQPTISNVNDEVYFQAYNKWLTRCINTFLKINIRDTVIDSFVDDFNDLIKFLILDYDLLRDGLIEYMAGVLESASLELEELRSVEGLPPEVGASEQASLVSAEPSLKDNQSVVPERLHLVYLKLSSVEIGDDGTEAGLKIANKAISSIKELTGKSSFVLITLDHRFYRVTVMKDGEVNIECVRE